MQSLPILTPATDCRALAVTIKQKLPSTKRTIPDETINSRIARGAAKIVISTVSWTITLSAYEVAERQAEQGKSIVVPTSLTVKWAQTASILISAATSTEHGQCCPSDKIGQGKCGNL